MSQQFRISPKNLDMQNTSVCLALWVRLYGGPPDKSIMVVRLELRWF